MAGPVLKRHTLTVLAIAGIAGPIIFATLAFVQSLVSGDHSLIADPISALAAGPSGWVQNMNFLHFGGLMIAYAVGLHLGVGPMRSGPLALAFLLLSGMGLIWAGSCPATDAGGAFQENRSLHTRSSLRAKTTVHGNHTASMIH